MKKLIILFISVGYSLSTYAADERYLVDRINAGNNRITTGWRFNPQSNPGGNDFTFLNAVGVVLTITNGKDIDSNGNVHMGTGTLIDRCHVLTAKHMAYRIPFPATPPLGQPVKFYAGQNEQNEELSGAQFEYNGKVIGYGSYDPTSDKPGGMAGDWTVIRLSTNASPSLAAIPVENAFGSVRSPGRVINRVLPILIAGYPRDKSLKDATHMYGHLWITPPGMIYRVWVLGDTGEGLASHNMMETEGNSGGPILAALEPGKYRVIGLVQGHSLDDPGEGLTPGEKNPNYVVILTATVIERINKLVAQTACD